LAGCRCRARDDKGFERGSWIVAHSAVAHSAPRCRGCLPMSSARIQQSIQQTSPLWPIQQPSIQQPSLSPTSTSRVTFARNTERYSQAQRYLEPKWLRTILLCRTLLSVCSSESYSRDPEPLPICHTCFSSVGPKAIPGWLCRDLLTAWCDVAS